MSIRAFWLEEWRPRFLCVDGSKGLGAEVSGWGVQQEGGRSRVGAVAAVGVAWRFDGALLRSSAAWRNALCAFFTCMPCELALLPTHEPRVRRLWVWPGCRKPCSPLDHKWVKMASALSADIANLLAPGLAEHASDAARESSLQEERSAHSLSSEEPQPYGRCRTVYSPRDHTACQGALSMSPDWLHRLREHERATHLQYLPGCNSSNSQCNVLAKAIHVLYDATAAHVLRPSVTARFDGHECPLCTLLVVGDSHALQLYDAALCALNTISGAVPLSRHPQYRQDANTSALFLLQRATSSHTDEMRTQLLESVVAIPPRHRSNNTLHALLVQLTFVSRLGLSDDISSDVLLAGHLQSVMRRLGKCAIVLYSEGMHSGATPPPLFRMAVRAAIAELDRISQRGGPLAFVWEVVAQHFHTLDGSGLYERTQRYLAPDRAVPTAPENATAAWYIKRHRVTLEKESHRAARGALQHPSAECNRTQNTVMDWRNRIFEEEVAHTSPSGNVQLLPFWRASQAWDQTLHVFNGDCSHVCFTPYYHLPLWHALWKALACSAQLQQSTHVKEVQVAGCPDIAT